MILDILAHLVALDIGWFITFVISNPIWVMIFAAAAYFLLNKRPIFGGTLLALYIHATVDAALILGWVFGKGFFFIPVLIFFGLIIFDSFFGKTKWSAKRTMVTTALFYGGMIFINVFLV